MKASFSIDVNRLKSNLNFIQTLLLILKVFFTIQFLNFTQPHSGPLGGIEGFVQLIPQLYRSNDPVNITGIDKTQLKYFYIEGSIVNGTLEPTSYSLN